MIPDIQESGHGNDVFISYSRKDQEFAGTLEKALKNYKPPKGLNVPQRNLAVFRDEADFTGVEYHQSLENYLKDSAKLIVICSPHARKSEYVNDEVRRFAKMRGSSNIIPVMLSGIPNNEAQPDQEEVKAFPEALTEVMDMPLAASFAGFDLHRDKVNKGVFYGPWYTILANIYDLSRSDIEQRDKKRNAHRRNITIGIVSGIIIALSAALMFALLSRRQAIEAREGERQQRMVAEKRRTLALSRQLSSQSELMRRQQPNLLQRSVLLAIESMHRAPSLEAVHALHNGTDLLPVTIRPLILRGTGRSLGFSDNGTYLASGSDAGWKIWDLARAEEFMGQKVGDVNSVAFSPGSKSAAFTYGAAVDVWSLTSREREIRIGHDLGTVTLEARFTTDGKHLVTAHGDGTVRIREADTGAEERRMKVTFWDGLDPYPLSPDGQYLADMNSAELRMLRVTTGEELWKVDIKRSGSIVSFSRDSRYLVTATGNRARIYRIQPFQEVRQFTIENNISIAEYAPAVNYLAIVDSVYRDTARVWDLDTGREIQRQTHKGAIFAIAFSPGGDSLATTGGDDTVVVSEISGPESFRESDRDFQYDLAFNGNGSVIAVAKGPSIVSVLNLSTGKELGRFSHDSQVQHFALRENGRKLITTTDKTLSIWNTGGDKPVSTVNHHKIIMDARLSMDDTLLALADMESVLVREHESGKEITRLQLTNFEDLTEGERLGEWGMPKVSLAFSRNSRFLMVDQAYEYDLLPRVLHITALGGQKNSWSLERSMAFFTPDSQYILSLGERQAIMDTQTGREIAPIVHNDILVNITMSGDGHLFATVTEKGAHVWKTATGKEVAALPLSSEISAISLSPSGRHLAAVAGREVIVLDVVDNSIVKSLSHDDYVIATAFSENEMNLATASNDLAVHVWEISSGKEVFRVKAPSFVSSVDFTPDGTHLVARSLRTARIWKWKDDDRIASACARLTVNMTCREWQDYIGDEPYRPTCPNVPAPEKCK